MNNAVTTNDATCRRCGTCCEKGGPSLHQEDRPLVDCGRIPGRSLVTIRRGELARDNVKGTLAPLPQEIIKIKGRQQGSWTCIFFDASSRGCRIYDDRPLECRALNCRDTRRIEAVYAMNRLTRQDVLAGVRGLWELIDDHERRCGYDRLQALVSSGLRGGRFLQERRILELIRYDEHLRRLTVEKGGLDARMLDFIFGRPVARTIHVFGVRVIEKEGAYGLVPQPAASHFTPPS